MFGQHQRYIELFLKSITMVCFQLISFDVLAEGRLASISEGMIAAATVNTQQLQILGIYGSAVQC